ncbi:MAG: ACP S-malonyltransferase [Thermodesulfobacteriota bacterium]
MKKIAFIFPGQGSQAIGMGKSLCEAYSVARDVFKEASEVLGFDMASLCFNGLEAELNKTENTQPAILTASVAALRVLDNEYKLTPSFVAGHSLGEYTALVCAGVLSFKDAVRIVRLRGRFMQESSPIGAGKMSAILGLFPDVVEAICKETSTENEPVVAANINSPEQVVISGEAKAVERAGNLASERGAKRVLPLPVSVPSHSPLMKPAAERLDNELSKISFNAFSFPLVSNVEAAPSSDVSKVRGLLKRQLTESVRWVDIIKRMAACGVEATIEIGPGKVLSGLVKRIDKGIQTLNFSIPEDLGKIKEALG